MQTHVTICAAILVVAACGGDDVATVDGGADDGAIAGDGGEDAFNPVSCDPVSQLGCQADEKCSVIPSQIYGEPPEVGCVAGGGSLGMMASCEPATFNQPDDCVRGMVCVGSAAPHCLPFCADFPVDTCAADQICAFEDDLDGDFIVDVMYCAQTCDLLEQDCGGAGIGCYPTRSGDLCAPVGAGETPVGEGELCDHANSCAVGLGCFQIDLYAWECLVICDPGGDDCAAWQFCNPVADENWGVCIDA